MTQHCGALVQGSYGGEPGNFELVKPALNGEGLIHYSRDNEVRPPRWGGPAGFGTQRVDGAALIQSDFGLHRRNLEVIACERVHAELAGAADRECALVHYWRDDPSYVWYRRRTPITAGVRGTPGFIQRPVDPPADGSSSAHGNFEVVVALSGGGLAHWWRDNEARDRVWDGPDLFGGDVLYDAVALMQSNFGLEPPPLPEGKIFRPAGNLELVARHRDRLVHYWHDGEARTWNGPFPIPLDKPVAGAPVLIQSTFGRRGHFVLAVPMAGGGVGVWQRDNDKPALPWARLHDVKGGPMSIVGLVQSTYGNGNLELVVRVGDRLEHHWLPTAGWIWQGPDVVAIEHIRREAEGVYGWTASYLQEGTHVTVRIELVPKADVTADELENARQRWQNGISDAWNCGCACRTPRGGHRAITFEVEWVNPEEQARRHLPRRPFDRVHGVARHHRVSVARYRKRANLVQWGLNTSGRVAAHEFGHMLGLPDEYPDPACPERWPVSTGTIMDVPDGPVAPRLLEHLCAPMCSPAVTSAAAAE